MPDDKLRAALQALLETLEAIAVKHEELHDTDVREQMFEAVSRAFLRPEPGYEFPEAFGMFEPEGNTAVREALSTYVASATARAEEIGLSDPNARLAAFQDGDVKTRRKEQHPDDFFGWAESV